MKKVIKKTTGILLILLGVLALVTPLTPGSWLIFVGLGLLGIQLSLWKTTKAGMGNSHPPEKSEIPE